MREAQTEIKAIEAQLRSIRADSRPGQGVAPKGLQSFPTDSYRSTPPNHPAGTTRTSAPPRNLASAQTHAAPPSRPAPSLPPLSHTPSQPVGHALQGYTSSGYMPPQQQPPQRQATQKAPPREAPPTQTTPPHGVQSYPLPVPPAHHSGFQQELAATLERLEQQSARYIQQFKQFQSLSPQHSKQVLNQSLQVLDTQAQYINQLSGIQETAIQELKTIAEQIEQDWKASEQTSASYVDAREGNRQNPQVFEYQNTAVPQVAKDKRGVYLLTSRSVDLYKAEREAALTAQALRLWSKREQAAQAGKPGFWARLTDTLTNAKPERVSSQTAPPPPLPATQPKPQRYPQTHPSSSPPPRPAKRARYQRSRPRRSLLASSFGVREAASFVLGAIAVRVLLNLVLSAYPILWTPTIALLATPAAIAVYRTSRTPRSGLVWGYRLLLIMIGLLLGGRL